MQPGFESDAEQLVPCRVKFDLVKAMAIAVESAQLRRELVGIEPELNGFRPAEPCTQGVQLALSPRRPFPPDRVTQNNVAREQIIGLKRRRLVLHLEHRRQKSPGKDAAIVPVESREQRHLLQ